MISWNILMIILLTFKNCKKKSWFWQNPNFLRYKSSLEQSIHSNKSMKLLGYYYNSWIQVPISLPLFKIFKISWPFITLIVIPILFYYIWLHLSCFLFNGRSPKTSILSLFYESRLLLIWASRKGSVHFAVFVVSSEKSYFAHGKQ